MCVSFLQSTDPTIRWRSARAVGRTATTPNTWTRSSAPSKVCVCVCDVWMHRWSVNKCVCVFVSPWTLAHLKPFCCLRGSFHVWFHVSVLVSIRLCVGWKSDLFFLSCFFPPRGSEHPFYVCEYTADPALLPTAPSITVSSLHTCGIFFIFASFYTFLYVCLYVNQPCGRAPKPSLWSRRWQPAAPGRNPPAGWNVGEKLSGGRIIVRRWGQEHATRASSRSFSEHHSMRRWFFSRVWIRSLGVS